MRSNADGPIPPLRATFVDLLHRAIAHGRTATAHCGLGPATQLALQRVACEHPEASADLIADACDAFDGEHPE